MDMRLCGDIKMLPWCFWEDLLNTFVHQDSAVSGDALFGAQLEVMDCSPGVELSDKGGIVPA